MAFPRLALQTPTNLLQWKKPYTGIAKKKGVSFTKVNNTLKNIMWNVMPINKSPLFFSPLYYPNTYMISLIGP